MTLPPTHTLAWLQPPNAVARRSARDSRRHAQRSLQTATRAAIAGFRNDTSRLRRQSHRRLHAPCRRPRLAPIGRLLVTLPPSFLGISRTSYAVRLSSPPPRRRHRLPTTRRLLYVSDRRQCLDVPNTLSRANGTSHLDSLVTRTLRQAAERDMVARAWLPSTLQRRKVPIMFPSRLTDPSRGSRLEASMSVRRAMLDACVRANAILELISRLPPCVCQIFARSRRWFFSQCCTATSSLVSPWIRPRACCSMGHRALARA